MYNSKKALLLVVLLACLLGLLLYTRTEQNTLAAGDNVYEQIKRFMEVLKAVKQYYVEDVDADKLVTGAINGMLEELDPHSVYIPADRLKTVTEQFEGYFYGIGIEFIVQNKILTVVAPIPGTPSERLGIRPGDQIIKIEGESTYGITEDEVMQKLRGPKGTQVTVTIRRPGIDEPFELNITRDKIPIKSVMADFMLDQSTGYILLGRFAKTTSQEVETALKKLEAQGMKQLILDLRSNSGGFLDQAVEVADKFIEGGKKIVFTKGRIAGANEEFISTVEATHPRYPLIILINKGSASASEIVAGAIQDWDRGLIVGETSFGKGLVQNQINLSDGSAIRVTIARYYTPSGRLIQRPYTNNLMDYYAGGFDDIDPNAIPDSVATRPVYWTNSGRKVYGGGGITPDITIKSGRITGFTSQLFSNRLFFEYGSEYAASHKELALNFTKFKDSFEVNKSMLDEFRRLIEKKGIEFKEAEFQKDLDYIKLLIKSEIARNVWGSEEYHKVYVDGDYQVQEALKLFPQAAKIAGLESPRR